MKALVVILALLVLATGLSLGRESLVAMAAIGGPLAVLLVVLWERLGRLERELGALRQALGVGAGWSLSRSAPGSASLPESAAPRQVPEPVMPEKPAPSGLPNWPDWSESAPATGERLVLDLDAGPAPGPRPGEPPTSPPTTAAVPADPLFSALLSFFTDGNLVVRVGILILFIGVGFLLKYAVDHSLLPLSLRLGGVAAGGALALALGWRLRGRRRRYALLLQGAGIGVIFLTTFAAARLFGVLEPLPALILMVALVAGTVFLALRQDAPGLAGFGIAGGYLAPLLVSLGTGSHVTLFGFYALLNLGVLAIAWFKAWKSLNLTGFLFTFGIGALWGARFYQPAFFPSVEPFLLFNFALYLAVAILFGTRQPPRPRELVDGTLIFALPLAAFALQAALVADREYGLAWSALGFGLTYLAVAALLPHLGGERLALLREAFLAIGIAFLTAAIPLALNGHWSSALWAAEGTGLVWIGVRQSRVLALTAGWLLQMAAGLVYLDGLDALDAAGAAPGSWPLLNGDALGSLILALSGLISSRVLAAPAFRGRAGAAGPFETGLAVWLLVWGGGWWLIWGLQETRRLFNLHDGFTLFLTFLALSGLAAGLVARALAWRDLARAGMVLLPLLWVTAWFGVLAAASPHPFADWNGPAWALTFGVQWWLLARCSGVWPEGLTRLWHGATLWLLLILAGLDLGWWGDHLAAGGAWPWAGWALPAVLILAGMPGLSERLTWWSPATRVDYRGVHLIPLALGLGGWVLLATLTPADPDPLPFLPLLNPVEALQLAVVVLLWRWSRLPPAAGWGLSYWIGLIAFGALSGWIAQGMHHLAGVPYTAADLFGSTGFQGALSIGWGLAALTAMWFANARGLRPVWVGGAALLGLVVLKLLLVDLSGSGSVARILSFIGVGVMMLAIGYLAPLPPADSPERRAPA